MIFKYILTNKDEIISRHKSLEKALHAQKYCKSCKNPVIKPIKGE